MNKIVLTNEQYKRFDKTSKDAERNSSFVDTNTQAIPDRRDLWLKVTSKTASTWNANQFVYTVDVYLTPFSTPAIKTGVKMFNAAEVGAGDPFSFIPTGRYVKAIDFLKKDDEWYYVCSETVSAPPDLPFIAYIASIDDLGIGWYYCRDVARVAAFDPTIDFVIEDYFAPVAGGPEINFLVWNKWESDTGRLMDVGEFVVVIKDSEDEYGVPIYRMTEMDLGCHAT